MTTRGSGITVFSRQGNLTAVKERISRSSAKEIDESFLMAAEFGHLDIVRFLSPKVSSLEVVNSRERTACMLAAKGGYLEVIKFLVSIGDNVRYRNDFGWTALKMAVLHSHLPIVQFLLENNAFSDRSVGDDPAENLLDIAVRQWQQRKTPKTSEILIAILHRYVAFEFFERVRYPLSDFYCPQILDRLPKKVLVDILKDSAYRNSSKILDYVLAKYPDFFDKNPTNFLMERAISNANIDIIQTLIKVGGSLTAPDSTVREAPAFMNIFSSHAPDPAFEEVIHFLLESGVDFRKIPVQIVNTYHLFVRNRRIEILQLIFDKGFPVPKDDSLLYQALIGKNPIDTIILLLEKGAIPSGRLLDEVANFRSLEDDVVLLLLNSGAFSEVHETVVRIPLLVRYGAYRSGIVVEDETSQRVSSFLESGEFLIPSVCKGSIELFVVAMRTGRIDGTVWEFFSNPDLCSLLQKIWKVRRPFQFISSIRQLVKDRIQLLKKEGSILNSMSRLPGHLVDELL